jgi:hypothetical protein
MAFSALQYLQAFAFVFEAFLDWNVGLTPRLNPRVSLFELTTTETNHYIFKVVILNPWSQDWVL